MIYAQAEDDFPRIEANYLTSLGRTAEADGEKAIWQDLRARLYVSEPELKADYAKSPAPMTARGISRPLPRSSMPVRSGSVSSQM